MDVDQKVVDESNSDVNRALAACGASSMPYRNFEDSNYLAPDPVPVVATPHEFPLLLEALPELGQVPAATGLSAQPIAGTPESPAPVPAAPERMALFAAPRQVAARRRFDADVSAQKSNAVPVDEVQTPRKTLTSVFRTLSAVAPARVKPIAAATGLQNLFSRL